jgi:hypothetical protein
MEQQGVSKGDLPAAEKGLQALSSWLLAKRQKLKAKS